MSWHRPDPHHNYPPQTESKVIIRFQDCDPLGHLNNAKYFDYLFNAREDQAMKIYRYSPTIVYEAFKCGWVVYNHNISYVRSAIFGEWVVIISRLLFYDEDTLIVEYLMTNERKTKIKCLLWTTLKYVDVAKGSKTKHQPEVDEYLKIMKYQENIDPDTDMFQRIKQVKEELIILATS